MGYTSYFTQYRSLTNKEWSAFTADTRRVIDYCAGRGIPLVRDWDSTDLPEVSAKHVWFNGVGDAGHETFVINKDIGAPQEWRSEPGVFNFCKTARKPYDLAVSLTLLALAHRAPGAFMFCSDGDWDDEWVEPRRVYRELWHAQPPVLFHHEDGNDNNAND